MARPKGSKDLAPMIRGAFKRACIQLDNKEGGEKGIGLSTLILESLQEDVRGTLQAIKGFVPKELEVTATVREVSHEEWLSSLEGGIIVDSESISDTEEDGT